MYGKGHPKRNEPEAFKKKQARVWNVQTSDNIIVYVTKSGSDKSTEVHWPPLECHRCKSHWLKANRNTCQSSNMVALHTVHLSPSNYAIFGPVKKALRGKWFTSDDDVKQYVRNWFKMQDSHSQPCVTVGQVPQQPRPILLTYRYWFLFLGLRLFSFRKSLIQVHAKNISYLILPQNAQ